jgi:hypothetical protein
MAFSISFNSIKLLKRTESEKYKEVGSMGKKLIDKNTIIKIAQKSPQGHVGIIDATITSVEKKANKLGAGIEDEYYLIHLTGGQVHTRINAKEDPVPFTEVVAFITRRLMDSEKLIPGLVVSFNGDWNANQEYVMNIHKLQHAGTTTPTILFAEFEPVSTIIKTIVTPEVYAKVISTIQNEVFEFQQNGSVYSTKIGSSHSNKIYDIAIATKSGKIVHEGCPQFKLRYRACKHIYAVLQIIIDTYPAQESNVKKIIEYLNRE